MLFSEKLKKAMQNLGINQAQLVGMTGIGKSSISQYLSGKNTPTAERQKNIAVSLGLAPDYFEHEEEAVAVMPRGAVAEGKIKRLLPEEAAVFLGMNHNTVRKGLQQGIFPWGYAIVTSINPDTGKKHWAYFINARRFVEIEGIELPAEKCVNIPSNELKQTNDDRIHSMNKEELAEFLNTVEVCGIKRQYEDVFCNACHEKNECAECWKEWLELETEEGEFWKKVFLP